MTDWARSVGTWAVLAVTACSFGTREDWSNDIAVFDLPPEQLAWTDEDRRSVLPWFQDARRLDVRGNAPGALHGDQLRAFLSVQFHPPDVAKSMLMRLGYYEDRTRSGNEFERTRAGEEALAQLRSWGDGIPAGTVLWTQELDRLGEFDAARGGFSLLLPDPGFKIPADEGGPLDVELLAMDAERAEALLPELDDLRDRGQRLLQYRLNNWHLPAGMGDALVGIPGDRTVRVYRALTVTGRNRGGCAEKFLCAYDADLVALVIATPGGRVLYAASDPKQPLSKTNDRPGSSEVDFTTWPSPLFGEMLRGQELKPRIDAALSQCVGESALGSEVVSWSFGSASASSPRAFDAELVLVVKPAERAEEHRWTATVSWSPSDMDPANATLGIDCMPPPDVPPPPDPAEEDWEASARAAEALRRDHPSPVRERIRAEFDLAPRDSVGDDSTLEVLYAILRDVDDCEPGAAGYSLSDEALRVMRNTPFALRGYTFSSSDLRDVFTREPWYAPVASVSADNPPQLGPADDRCVEKLRTLESR